MATMQVTPKECLFGQVHNAWLHVCKLNGQKPGCNSHVRRWGHFPPPCSEQNWGMGLGRGRKGGRGVVRRGRWKRVLILHRPLEEGGGTIFSGISLWVFIYLFILFCWQLYPNKNKMRAFSPCLHLGSCFPPAPENVTPP